jgi:competence protein ComEC
VKTMEQWPCALLKGISITGFETALIYLLIILFFYYFNKQKFNYLVGTFCIAIIILCSQIIEQHQQFQQKKLIIYNIPKTNAIDFIDAKSNVLLTNKTFATNERGLLFHIKHNWWDLGINDTKIVSDSIQTKNLLIKNNVIRFYDKRIIIVNENKLFLETLPVDFLIISNNPTIHISDLLKNYHPRKIIFDSSNYNYRITKWKKECAIIHQPYYSVQDEGALVVNL